MFGEKGIDFPMNFWCHFCFSMDFPENFDAASRHLGPFFRVSGERGQARRARRQQWTSRFHTRERESEREVSVLVSLSAKGKKCVKCCFSCSGCTLTWPWCSKLAKSQSHTLITHHTAQQPLTSLLVRNHTFLHSHHPLVSSLYTPPSLAPFQRISISSNSIDTRNCQPLAETALLRKDASSGPCRYVERLARACPSSPSFLDRAQTSKELILRTFGSAKGKHHERCLHTWRIPSSKLAFSRATKIASKLVR